MPSLEAAEFSDALTRATAKRTGTAEHSVGAGGATFAWKGRTISILPHSVGDRALIVYSDLPDAMSGGVIDAAAIRITMR